MIKTSHAIGVNILALFLITGYFSSMLDDMRIEIFALQDKLQEEIEANVDGSYDVQKSHGEHYYKLKQ